jgi:hypothetical protein
MSFFENEAYMLKNYEDYCKNSFIGKNFINSSDLVFDNYYDNNDNNSNFNFILNKKFSEISNDNKFIPFVKNEAYKINQSKNLNYQDYKTLQNKNYNDSNFFSSINSQGINYINDNNSHKINFNLNDEIKKNDHLEKKIFNLNENQFENTYTDLFYSENSPIISNENYNINNKDNKDNNHINDKKNSNSFFSLSVDEKIIMLKNKFKNEKNFNIKPKNLDQKKKEKANEICKKHIKYKKKLKIKIKIILLIIYI